MSTKAKAKPSKAAAPAKSAPAKAAKATKGSKSAKPAKELAPATPAVDEEGNPIDVEEAEEAAEEASAKRTSGGGNAAAAAAAAGGEVSTSFKSFRHHPDMENFYRFIYENDLRHEALALLDQMIAAKRARKAAAKSGAAAKKS
jgi:hypothetical protein